MSLATIYSRAAVGIDAPLVTVEVHIANGLPGLSIVGLPEAAVKESKDRVRGALQTAQFEFPAKRITINLAPADLPKEGARFDLAIAMGILAATGQVPMTELKKYEFIGELALSGEIRPVKGVLPSAMQTQKADRALVIAPQNLNEAQRVAGVIIFAPTHLLTLCQHLRGDQRLAHHEAEDNRNYSPSYSADLQDVRGQAKARRALEIAAAGRHSLLFYGPPGTGKTMLASRLVSILPPMNDKQALETAAIYSVSGKNLDDEQWRLRPFRNPHHTASAVALVGGGSMPRPGEISLAHNGVLFLDELPEFDRNVLEVLREPLETGSIHISRAARYAIFPAQFQLIAAMNPCPCGYLGDKSERCRCTSEQVQRYRNKLSGPLLDRIDMHLEVAPIDKTELRLQSKTPKAESSLHVRQRVLAAYQTQQNRGCANAFLPVNALEKYCVLSAKDNDLLETAMERLRLSARAYHRILKLARTCADLAHKDNIETDHLLEALSYRNLDRGVA
ncbi:MAG: YifB family Mg chelatase-like AAA ATPase [Gammaproteobacteria bacterium]|nr:YifB family Mg chelatase-like AAA ATPase [Gammaproteobacteria bacterium]MDH5729407.1 YifB family Mg chelatase-like AAA ATPase [Gammaproteobacteria bacterium]